MLLVVKDLIRRKCGWPYTATSRCQTWRISYFLSKTVFLC